MSADFGLHVMEDLQIFESSGGYPTGTLVTVGVESPSDESVLYVGQ